MKIIKHNFSDLNIEVKLLLLILFLYSFSFAWPKMIGIIEVIIGVLLIVWLFRPIIYLLRFRKPLISLIFFSLLIIPTIVGIINHNDFSSMIRDIIPCFYFMIPLIVLVRPINQQVLEQILKYIPWMLSIVGVVFSIREILSNGSTLYFTHTYLMFSPVVLFSAVFTSLQTINQVQNKNYYQAFISFIFAYISIGTLYFTILRAPILLWMFFILSYIFFRTKKLLLKVVIILVILIVGSSYEFIKGHQSVSYGAAVEQLTQQSNTISSNDFITKQNTFKTNNKLLEIVEMKESLMHEDNVLSLLFGKGFGSKFYSSSTGGYVGFTHLLISYLTLKMGLLGTVIFLIYILFIIKVFFNILKDTSMNNHNFILLSSIVAIFVVNIWLQPGFKTLDFGIISLLYFALHKIINAKNVLKELE